LKIAVSAVTESLDAQIDPRFGRCPCFVIVDSETMGFEAIPNTSQSAPSGAGIQAAQTIANKGVKLLLTGRVGPNAFQVLSSAGVEIITSVSGTVREAIERFKTGQLRDTTTLSTPTIGFGVGSGYGSGMGMGRGRGMGKGRGRGVRRWQTTEPSFSPPTSLPPTSHPPTSIPTGMSREQEIQTLESQMKVMQQQMDQIRKRLNELQK
jgi:predicted Fe-Mo cluster-binding NifX family protein